MEDAGGVDHGRDRGRARRWHVGDDRGHRRLVGDVGVGDDDVGAERAQLQHGLDALARRRIGVGGRRAAPSHVDSGGQRRCGRRAPASASPTLLAMCSAIDSPMPPRPPVMRWTPLRHPRRVDGRREARPARACAPSAHRAAARRRRWSTRRRARGTSAATTPAAVDRAGLRARRCRWPAWRRGRARGG